MNVSHEVPLVLLEESRAFNDYDYALVHLFETHPEYFAFYKKSLEMGRDVLLDNSIFELREAFSFERFAFWIEELMPTRYVIPDVMYNAKGTIYNILKWMDLYDNLPGQKIGVVQGRNYEELTHCYKVISKHCDEISINVVKEYCPIVDPTKTRDWNYMVGRQGLIDRWINEGVINHDKPHHLLGCRLPQEFSHYKNYDFIKSLDTSNPVVHAILGIRYNEFGLQKKEDILLADLLDTNLSNRQIKDILYNVERFKIMMNRE